MNCNQSAEKRRNTADPTHFAIAGLHEPDSRSLNLQIEGELLRDLSVRARTQLFICAGCIALICYQVLASMPDGKFSPVLTAVTAVLLILAWHDRSLSRRRIEMTRGRISLLRAAERTGLSDRAGTPAKRTCKAFEEGALRLRLALQDMHQTH